MKTPKSVRSETNSNNTFSQRCIVAVLFALLFPSLATVARPERPSHLFSPKQPVRIEGVVQTGGAPSPYTYNVSLYRAGNHHFAAGAVLLGRTLSGSNGHFQIFYNSPKANGAILYLIADGYAKGSGHSPIRLAAVLDPAATPDYVTINERTTVATAYAMARFTHNRQIGGKSPGLKNAAGTAQNLADVTSGDIGSVLGDIINGNSTSTMRTFNSLANALAACTESMDNCDALLAAATPPRGPAPRNTLQAMVNIAKNPWKNVADIFALSQQSTAYSPALQSTNQPNAWTLALRYNGNGPEGQHIDGPGNIAFDKDGNAWVCVNYTYDPIPTNTVCGGTNLVALTPTGGSLPGAPYFGGGLYGAGYGITFDLKGNIWVGNFGFQGKGCTNDFLALSKSVSEFSPDGSALSPAEGYMRTNLFNQPQGMACDRQGNIWVANAGGGSVTVIPDGDPDRMWNINDVGSKPFGLAIDTRGNAWVALNNERTGSEAFPSGAVREISPDGSIVGPPINGDDGVSRPMGVATDSRGNVWVSDSGVVDVTVGTNAFPGDMITQDVGENGERNTNAAVTLIQPVGNSPKRVVKTFGVKNGPRGGIALPWGIAVDGDDNVFVANFAGQRLTELCGVRLKNCPPGKQVGDAISPDTGYTFDGLKRITAVQVDSSGNVWLANNWIQAAKDNQTNPGGHQVVVFVGLAAPVKTPLIGPPQKP